MTTVLTQVQTILARVLRVDADAITPDSSIRDLPNVDSAAILESVVAIEDHFGVEFPDALVLRLDRVTDVADALEDILAREVPAIPPVHLH